MVFIKTKKEESVSDGANQVLKFKFNIFTINALTVKRTEG